MHNTTAYTSHIQNRNTWVIVEYHNELWENSQSSYTYVWATEKSPRNFVKSVYWWQIFLGCSVWQNMFWCCREYIWIAALRRIRPLGQFNRLILLYEDTVRVFSTWCSTKQHNFSNSIQRSIHNFVYKRCPKIGPNLYAQYPLYNESTLMILNRIWNDNYRKTVSMLYLFKKIAQM